MTGPDHYVRAEELLASLSETHPDPEAIAQAQVHPTLALAAATALAERDPAGVDWREVAGVKFDDE